MRVSVSDDSVQALRALSEQMLHSVEHIEESTLKFQQKYLIIENQLGNNKERYANIVNGCVCAVANAAECIRELAPRLNQAVDEISDYLNRAARENQLSTTYNRSNNHSSTIEAGQLSTNQVSNNSFDGKNEKPRRSDDLRLPTLKMGSFEGELGNSLFIPSSEPALQVLSKFGKTGVFYINGYPDFSPFATHETPWGQVDTRVEIGHMTSSRANPKWEYGRRLPGQTYNLSYDLGNYNQADLALCQKILEDSASGGLNEIQALEKEKIDLCQRIADYRKKAGLTWHECPDGATMMLVPAAIHGACPHSGGVSLKKMLEKYGDVDNDYCD